MTDAQPEQEPLAHDNCHAERICRTWCGNSACASHYANTTPPAQRTWVGLTKEEIAEFDTWHDHREEEVGWCNPSEIVAYIEAKLKDKNT